MFIGFYITATGKLIKGTGQIESSGNVLCQIIDATPEIEVVYPVNKIFKVVK
jgi:hypothetical protein